MIEPGSVCLERDARILETIADDEIVALHRPNRNERGRVERNGEVTVEGDIDPARIGRRLGACDFRPLPPALARCDEDDRSRPVSSYSELRQRLEQPAPAAVDDLERAEIKSTRAIGGHRFAVPAE